jgi:hypothetical protein
MNSTAKSTSTSRAHGDVLAAVSDGLVGLLKESHEILIQRSRPSPAAS